MRSEQSEPGSTHGSPRLSVICTTYNHIDTVAQTLDSLLAQKTDFPYEIIVHDDASTDGTADIVRDFLARFPSRIRGVLQETNQYSKGGFRPSVYASSHSRAEYVALCEGDDYWLDESKLQMQFDLMEAHPDIDFSFHQAFRVGHGGREKLPDWDYGKTRVLSMDELLSLKVGSFAPTCSYMLRRRVLESLPEWFFTEAPVGDYFIERYASRRGGALYLDRPMAAYRELGEQSWTRKMSSDPVSYVKYLDGMLKCLQLMTTDFSSHAERLRQVKAALYLRWAISCLYQHKDDEFRQKVEESVTQYRYVSRKQRVAHMLRKFPAAFRLILRIRSLSAGESGV